MSNKKYIILNFTHGNGPYLRTGELALAINNVLGKKGLERMGIIMPWVYKNRQKTILTENFGKFFTGKKSEIFLDKNLGEYLKKVFYNGDKYEKTLKNVLLEAESVKKQIQNYLSEGLTIENYAGDKITVKKEDILMEIKRCPIINFDIKPSYYTGFAYLSDIFSHSVHEPQIKIDKDLLRKIADYYSKIEESKDIGFIAEPSTFPTNMCKSSSTLFTPPNAKIPPKYPFYRFVEKGVYVSITGIIALNEKIFHGMHDIGIKIYTNKPAIIPFSKKSNPNIISNKNILLHFARVGWGSAWRSFFTGTPLIMLPYDQNDDPEVYFNNISLEKIGLGKIYGSQSTDELMEFSSIYKKNLEKAKNDLIKKYGTIDGVQYTAEKIVEHFLKNGKLS